jgi:hypothetical protein
MNSYLRDLEEVKAGIGANFNACVANVWVRCVRHPDVKSIARIHLEVEGK